MFVNNGNNSIEIFWKLPHQKIIDLIIWIVGKKKLLFLAKASTILAFLES